MSRLSSTSATLARGQQEGTHSLDLGPGVDHFALLSGADAAHVDQVGTFGEHPVERGQRRLQIGEPGRGVERVRGAVDDAHHRRTGRVEAASAQHQRGLGSRLHSHGAHSAPTERTVGTRPRYAALSGPLNGPHESVPRSTVDSSFNDALFSLPVILISLAIGVLMLVAVWKVFAKAGEPGWASLIPFYNTYVEFRMAGYNPWLFLLLLVPVVNIVLALLVSYKIGETFGRDRCSTSSGWCCSPVGWLILGSGDAQYRRPAAA